MWKIPLLLLILLGLMGCAAQGNPGQGRSPASVPVAKPAAVSVAEPAEAPVAEPAAVPTAEKGPAKVSRPAFLENATNLQAGSKRFELMYVKEGVNFSSYSKVMVDPLAFSLKEETRYRRPTPKEIKELSDTFNKAFVDALGTGYLVVARPGPGVMRLRAAVTEIVPNKPAMSLAMAILPGGFLAYAMLSKKYNNIGSATLEAELLDSETGERLAAVIDKRIGKKTEIFTAMETWGHTRKAFKIWAKEFRLWLDAACGK